MERNEDCETCWICLEGAEGVDTPTGPIHANRLIKPCRCPRVVHSVCLAKWQLSQSGRSEEKFCRFCKERLPDWQSNLALPGMCAVEPVMSVHFNGQTHMVKVKPGEEGRLAFILDVRRLLRLRDNQEFSITFECKVPGHGMFLDLKGLSSYDAAVFCAAMTAVERQRLAAQKAATRSAPAAGNHETRADGGADGDVSGTLQSCSSDPSTPPDRSATSPPTSSLITSTDGSMTPGSNPSALTSTLFLTSSASLTAAATATAAAMSSTPNALSAPMAPSRLWTGPGATSGITSGIASDTTSDADAAGLWDQSGDPEALTSGVPQALTSGDPEVLTLSTRSRSQVDSDGVAPLHYGTTTATWGCPPLISTAEPAGAASTSPEVDSALEAPSVTSTGSLRNLEREHRLATAESMAVDAQRGTAAVAVVGDFSGDRSISAQPAQQRSVARAASGLTATTAEARVPSTRWDSACEVEPGAGRTDGVADSHAAAGACPAAVWGGAGHGRRHKGRGFRPHSGRGTGGGDRPSRPTWLSRLLLCARFGSGRSDADGSLATP